MRALPAAATTLLLAAALSGCLDVPFEMKPINIDIDLSGMSASAQLTSLTVTPGYAPLEGRATMRVEGAVHTAARVDGVHVDLWLVHGPCPMGPPGTPDRYADHARIDLGALNGTAPFESRLSAYALLGEPMAVYAHVEPHGLGPGFSTCRDVVASPDAPSAAQDVALDVE